MQRNAHRQQYHSKSNTLKTIYDNLIEKKEKEKEEKNKKFELKIRIASAEGELLIGSITLLSLYNFLKNYRAQTGDLDKIYEKNVRRFLGGRGKVNRAMQNTLRSYPEKFGLYNNGITIVVNDYKQYLDSLTVTEPYIVNGCQTTRTIWDVFHNRLNTGGTGLNPDIEDWKKKASRGYVIVKIVKIGSSGESLLQEITRYTNSQNAIREKDFLALTNDFRTWQEQLSKSYDIYLEIQRGGWDSQKALQNNNHKTKRFIKHANAADLRVLPKNDAAS